MFNETHGQMFGGDVNGVLFEVLSHDNGVRLAVLGVVDEDVDAMLGV
jgi:hypothetical protein